MMEYALPHAVLAFLQEENSPHLPKSYFISSSTKSTKITLIYTREKRNQFKESRKKTKQSNNLCNSQNTDNNSLTNHRERHSSSSTDDYTQRVQSMHNCRYVGSEHTKQRHRICASTPGRGYSDAARVHAIQRSAGSAKMATDPVLRHSPSKDHLTINHFTNDNRDHNNSDSDLSYHYAPLSPSSVLSERPPTPGRFFEPSSTPRPPTPNASNYASLMSSANARASTYTTPSRRTDHPNLEAHPPRPHGRRSNNRDLSQSKSKVTTDTSKTSKPKTDNLRFTPPPITIRSPSPNAPPTLTKMSADSRSLNPYSKFVDGQRR